VDLTWTNDDAVGVEWVIERAADANFNGGLTVFDDFYPATVSFTDTAVIADTTYYYRVAEKDTDANQSGWSNTASIVTPPPAPSDVAASVVWPEIGPPSGVSLTWTNNASPAGSNAHIEPAAVTDLLIERAADSGFTTAVTDVVADPAAQAFLDNGVSEGTTYYYRVKAQGNMSDSAWSDVASILVPLTAPPAPASLTTRGFAPGTDPGRVDVTWTESNGASPVTGFIIQRATNSAFTTGFASFTAGPTVTGYTLAGLLRGHQYYIRIAALNDTVSSPWTTVIASVP